MSETWLESTEHLDVRPMPNAGLGALDYASDDDGESVSFPVETRAVFYSPRIPEAQLDVALAWSLGGDIRSEARERGADTVYVSPIERRTARMFDPSTFEPVDQPQAYCYVAYVSTPKGVPDSGNRCPFP